VEPRWLAVKNWDNNAGIYRRPIGIISSSDGEEKNESEWDALLVGETEPLGGPENTPGNKYFKFVGTVSTTISAVIANGVLEFLEWRIAHLVPKDGGGFTISEPKVKVGTEVPSIQIVTNRHYVLDAVPTLCS